MNISGLIGFLFAMGMIVWGILMGGPIDDFVDPPSIAIVIGGTIGVIIFAYPISVLKNVPKMMKVAFFPTKFDPESYIEEMVDHCKTARMKGILALEEAANACENPFMKSALMLIVDANDSDKVKGMLDDAIDFMSERHEGNYALWAMTAASAPAIGMLGTLIGLVQMLKSMDPNDPDQSSSLGAAMSMAMITTFYGAILANVIANPIGNLCKYNHNKEILCLQIIEEGTLAIISGANPRYVEEKLRMMLPATAKAGKGKGKSAADDD